MAYDRDLTANPLRRLRGILQERTDLHPTTRRHLTQTVDDLIDACHTFASQQAAAKGVMAHSESLRCDEAMRKAKPGDRAHREAMLAFVKLTQLANSCFKIAGVKVREVQPRVKPPTRQRESATHAGVS